MGPRYRSFLCADCGDEFTRKYNLARHIIRLHTKTKDVNSKRGTSRIICPFCELVCGTIAYLESHLRVEHSIELNSSKFTFTSETEFLQWKEKEESSSVSLFMKDKSYKKKNGERVIIFTCNRSGVYKKSGNGQRMARSKGSCKIGFYCTARIVAIYEPSGGIRAEYHSTHVGHEHQFCYLRLPNSQEKLIADKLKEGENLDQILNEVRNEITASSSLEKKHFLNKKNLFNIIKKYKISGIPKSDRTGTKNLASAETLLNECKQMSHNPILFYKKQGETHQVLYTDEIMLVVMNDVQIELLKKFVEEKICIDSTNYMQKSHFKLTALLVIDEYGEEFPCCFCITNRIDEITMTLLFETVKSATGILHTKVLLTDDDPFYHVAWDKVMAKAEIQVLCKWHVDENWKNNLKLVNDKTAKCEIYSQLKSLLEETDQNKFFSALNTFLTELRDDGFHDFCNYFTSNYAYRLELWASCYRSKDFLNHDRVLEAFHRVLKHIHIKGTKQKNIDVLLTLIFKSLREKVFNRLRCMEDSTGTSHAEKLYKRHRRHKEVKDISTLEPNQWQVQCDRQSDISYVVKLEAESCECKRKCVRCAACVHMYSCTCNDYLITHNLCKHIHALAMQNVHESTEVIEEPIPTPVESNNVCDVVIEDVCQVLEVGNSMTKESKSNLILKLNQCVSLLNETDCENVTLEMEDQMNNNVDSILTLLYGNSKVSVVESIF